MSLKSVASTLALALVSAIASPVWAQVIPADCLPAEGVFITTNSLPNGHGGTTHSLSLLTLTNRGLAYRTDSDQDVGRDYSGFSNSQGVWACEGVRDGVIALTATLVNFSNGVDYRQEGSIARISYSGRYILASKKLDLEGQLVFFTFTRDINTDAPQGHPIPVRIYGYKVENAAEPTSR